MLIWEVNKMADVLPIIAADMKEQGVSEYELKVNLTYNEAGQWSSELDIFVGGKYADDGYWISIFDGEAEAAAHAAEAARDYGLELTKIYRDE